MKKSLFCIGLFLILSILVSCASQSAENPLVGVWKCSDPEYDCTFSFTSDGYYAREVFSEGRLSFCEFGPYTYDDEFVYAGEYQYLYGPDGKKLLLDGYVYTRKSRIAKNSSSNLKGVWADEHNLLGFTSSFAVCSGTGYFLKDYEAQDYKIKIGKYKDADYLIINSKLYIRDAANLMNEGSVCVLTRKTSSGHDSATRSILVSYSPWHLVEVYNGENHYLYTFKDSGSYELIQFTGNGSDSKTYNGTFTYKDNYVDLSDNSDIHFAIIDDNYFMFTR